MDIKSENISWICPDCSDTRSLYELKLIATNRHDTNYPKYIPMIKATCYCGKFIKFAKQTPELIASLNTKLELFEMKGIES